MLKVWQFGLFYLHSPFLFWGALTIGHSFFVAKNFAEKNKKIGDWKKELKARPGDFKTTGMIALDAVIGLWQIPRESAFRLLQMKKDEISSAEPIAGEFAAFRILDKQTGDEEKFEKEKKTEILDRLTQQKKFERFMAWSSELTQKARLKDYLPQSEAPQAPPGEPKPAQAGVR